MISRLSQRDNFGNVLSFNASSDAGATKSLMAWMPLTVDAESIVGAFTPTVTGSPVFSADGVNNIGDVSSITWPSLSSLMDLTKDWSLDFNFKMATNEKQRIIITPTDENTIRCDYWDGGVRGWFYQTSVTMDGYNTNQHNVKMIRKSDVASIYYDNVLVAQHSISSELSVDQLKLGKYSYDGSANFWGTVKDIKIFNKAIL